MPAVRVSVDTQTKVDLRLELGELTEAVTVTAAEGQLLKTDRADVATTFESEQITELPILDRNFTKLILLTPGTQRQNWNHAASENPQGSTQTQVNGQTFAGPATSSTAPRTATPSSASSSSTRTWSRSARRKITSQNYDAEFGQAIAGVVSVQTKSGTNEFHGSALRVPAARQVPGPQPVHAAGPARTRSPAACCPRPSATSSAGPSAVRSCRTSSSSSPTTRARAPRSAAPSC